MTHELPATKARKHDKPHHYHFVVYALDANLDLKPGLNRAELLAAVQGHVIGQGELVAMYER